MAGATVARVVAQQGKTFGPLMRAHFGRLPVTFGQGEAILLGASKVAILRGSAKDAILR